MILDELREELSLLLEEGKIDRKDELVLLASKSNLALIHKDIEYTSPSEMSSRFSMSIDGLFIHCLPCTYEGKEVYTICKKILIIKK